MTEEKKKREEKKVLIEDAKSRRLYVEMCSLDSLIEACRFSKNKAMAYAKDKFKVRGKFWDRIKKIKPELNNENLELSCTYNFGRGELKIVLLGQYEDEEVKVEKE